MGAHDANSERFPVPHEVQEADQASEPELEKEPGQYGVDTGNVFQRCCCLKRAVTEVVDLTEHTTKNKSTWEEEQQAWDEIFLKCERIYWKKTAQRQAKDNPKEG